MTESTGWGPWLPVSVGSSRSAPTPSERSRRVAEHDTALAQTLRGFMLGGVGGPACGDETPGLSRDSFQSRYASLRA